MEILFFWIYIFLDLLYFFVLFDVIISWLPIFWIKFNPKFVRDLLDPIYQLIQKVIPTTIWPISFNAFILLLIIYVLQIFLLNISPSISNLITNI